MSVVWHDTPSYYSTSTIAAHWDIVSNMGVDSNDGYDGGPALTATSGTGYCIQDCDQFAGGNIFAEGGRFKATSNPSAETIIFGIVGFDRGLRIAVTQLTDGKLAVYRGNLEQLLAITSSAITLSTQLRLGISGVLASGAAGSVVLKIDGAIVAQASGVDTGSDPWRGVYFGATTAMFWSMVYAGDDGVQRPAYYVEAKFSSDSDLDDADHDGDTTKETVAQDASFASTIASAAARRVVYGLRTIAVVKAADAAGWKPELTVEDTVFTGDRQPITTGYSAIGQFYATNPLPGVAFTGADLIDADLAIGGKPVA